MSCQHEYHREAARLRNTPLFREDNCSLTLGRDGKYHFIFTLPEELVDELPDRLLHQALSIAQKASRMMSRRLFRLMIS